MTIDELKTEAASVARALRDAPAPSDGVRKRFVAVRAALFERGIFDPVLVRFDTITVPRASTQEIAEQLEAIASSLV